MDRLGVLREIIKAELESVKDDLEQPVIGLHALDLYLSEFAKTKNWLQLPPRFPRIVDYPDYHSGSVREERP